MQSRTTCRATAYPASAEWASLSGTINKQVERARSIEAVAKFVRETAISSARLLSTASVLWMDTQHSVTFSERLNPMANRGKGGLVDSLKTGVTNSYARTG